MKTGCRVLSMMLILLAASVNAWAGDNIQVSVSDSHPEADIKLNGNDVIQGTIQLFYTVESYAFTEGSFGTFKIDMKDVHLNGALNNAAYPATLKLKQNGSQNLTLTPATNTFYVSGLGWTDSTTVTIFIPHGVPNADGTDLVGNLAFNIPGQNKVGTPTGVQVHIRLVHPTNCLKVYNFLADAGALTVYDDTFSMDVKVKNGQVNSASPGTISYNLLVANICSQNLPVDIGAILDAAWEVTGAQGVKLYSAAGEVDLTNYDVDLFDNPVNNGQNLCLQNATILSGQSYLLNIKMGTASGLSEASIGSSPFTFSATLTQANSACAGSLEPLANPNPVNEDLAFIISYIGSAKK